MRKLGDHVWAALPVPAMLIDQDDCILGVNPAAELFMNAPEHQTKGVELDRIFFSDMNLRGAVGRARKSASTLFCRDVNVAALNQMPTRCDLQIAPIGDEVGALLLLMQPRHIEGQLGSILRVNDAAKTAIGLAEMLAHEIKNPLAGISGAAQLLSMSLSKEDRDLTDLILQETTRVVDLLKQVEHFGDLRPPCFKLLNIHDILERARKSSALGAASHMRFKDNYDPSLPMISGDGDQLIQVISNLFANAAEATRGQAGTISIRTFYEHGLRLSDGGDGQAVPLQIEISDDGPGIPDAIRNTIFDPFISGRENGTGLGLALVSKIISAHKGTIFVSSKPGQTVFRISLPFANQEKGTV